MEKTLVILKPSAVERSLIGVVTSRFENKGLYLVGCKMLQLTDELLAVHYLNLKDKPYFKRVKDSMKSCPVVVQCWSGIDAVTVVRNIVGVTNGRNALAGTIRGDYSISSQENIVHASDSLECAEREINLFFKKDEILDYNLRVLPRLYSDEEL